MHHLGASKQSHSCSLGIPGLYMPDKCTSNQSKDKTIATRTQAKNEEITRYHDDWLVSLGMGIGGCLERLNVDGIRRLTRRRVPLFRREGS